MLVGWMGELSRRIPIH